MLDDLRLLVRGAERERGVDLLEAFEHFDRRGQVDLTKRHTLSVQTSKLAPRQQRMCLG